MSAPPPMIDRSAHPCPRTSRHPARRRALVAVGLLVFGGLTAASGGSAQRGALSSGAVALGALPGQVGPAITGVSLESTPGDPAEAIGGRRPAVSEDGRLVAFIGPALAAAPTADSGDEPVDDSRVTAHLRDRETGVLVDLVPLAEGQRPGETSHALVSSDGCSVTVLTQVALDLFDDDDEGERWDVYRAGIPRCRPRDLTVAPLTDASDLVWELVSSDGDGRARNDVDAAFAPSVSATGTVVAYVVPVAPRRPQRRVLVTDLTVPVGEPGRTETAPGLPADPPSSGARHVGQIEPAVSGDGNVVAYASDADAAAPSATWTSTQRGRDAVTQVYRWDRTTGDVDVVSRAIGATDTARADRRSRQPSVSYDGSTVAFVSASRDLVGGSALRGRPGITQVHVWRADGDRNGAADDPVIEVVSRRPGRGARAGAPGNGPSWSPSVSADGTTVAFLTRADDLLPLRGRPGRAPGDGDVIVADLVHATLQRAGLRPDAATPSRGAHGSPVLSASGRVVVFDTAAASEMVPGAPRSRDRQVVAASFPVTLSLPALDTGTTPPGWPSPEWYLTVSNTGSSAFVPRVVQSSDHRFAVTGGSCVGARVAPGESCTVRIVFTPDGPGDVVAELMVAETGFRAAEVTTSISGSGGEPALSATPAGLALPATAVGQTSAPASIEVANVGWYPATVSEVIVGGEHADDVRISASPCTGRVLFPAETCAVEVVFAPTAAGERSALVTFVTTTGSRTSALVSGTASHQPAMAAPEEIRAGRPIDVMAWGYPADTVVVVAWADGLGRSLAVASDSEGALVARLPIHGRERPGRRTLVISDPAGRLPTVSQSVLVRPGR